MGAVPRLPRPRVLVGLLRSIEEQERQVVLDVLLRQPGQGPGVPRTAGGGVTTLDLALRAPGGEPVDLWRTLVSHGFAELSPTVLDEEHRTLGLTVRVPGGRPRRVRVSEGPRRRARVEVLGPKPGPEGRSRRARGHRPRAPARPGPLVVLPPRGGGSRSRVGGGRCRPDAPIPHRVRRRREDGLHDELHLERHGADGERPRHAPGRPRDRRRRAAHQRLPDARRDGRGSGVVLSRRGPRRLSRRIPALARSRGRRRRSRPGGLRRRRRRRIFPTRSSRPRSSRSRVSDRTPPPTS